MSEPLALPPRVAALLHDAPVIAVGGDRPLRLHHQDVWIVRRGEVNIFTVEFEGDQAVGPRRFFCRVGTGDPMFGLAASAEPRQRGLLAVGTIGAELHHLHRTALHDVARDPTAVTGVRALVERWVEALYDGIATGAVPRRCEELEPGEAALGEGAAARPRQSVSWLRHLDGHSYLLGRDGLRVNGHGLTPVARRAWIETREPSRILLVDGAALHEPEAMWDGLENLHALVMRHAVLVARELEDANRERLRQWAAASASAIRGACSRLALALDPAVSGHRRAPTAARSDDHVRTEDALLAACSIVGEALDVRIASGSKVEGPAGGGGVPRDRLNAILRASRLRARTVALRDGWWRHDNGPMLGYLGTDKRPVALIPASGRAYTIHDPTVGTSQRLTDATIAELTPFARTLYRPFPDIALGVKDVLRFGLFGCRKDFVMLLTMGLAAAVLGMIPSIATGMLFNTIIPGANRSQVLQLTLVLVVCALATTAFNVARGIALLRIEGNMGSAVQAAIWDRLLSLPLPFFRPYTAGDLAVRAMSIDGIRQIISGATVTALMGGIFSIGNFILMFYYSPTMAWRGSLLILLALSVTIAGSLLQLRSSRAVLLLQAKTSGIVLQLLTSVTKLRVAGAEPWAFAVWARRFAEQRTLQYRVRSVANWLTAFNASYPVAAYILIFWTALPLIAAGTGLQTGDFLAFLSAFTSCLTALLGTCLALVASLNAIPMYETAKPILTTLPEVDVGKADPGVLSGDVEIQHAIFRYQPDAPPLLRDLTLRVRPGEFVALVGPSGSGKSTILRLLLGFEALESGAIYYDGQELSGLDVQAVRRQIGVVLQSGRLMSGDIFTNICGSSPITMDEAWEAARMAGFDEDVKSMPMGMHTVISEGGGTLSGGQRQRLLIARSIVHRPRILLFDEATSALDNRTQAVVGASLERLQATRIVVAHRLSTIVKCDRIYVIERGRIVQTGAYGELLEQDGLFATLAKRQLA